MAPTAPTADRTTARDAVGGSATPANGEAATAGEDGVRDDVAGRTAAVVLSTPAPVHRLPGPRAYAPLAFVPGDGGVSVAGPSEGAATGEVVAATAHAGDGDSGQGGSGPAPSCAGIARRSGDSLVIDGEPVFFFGLNAPQLLAPEFPEARVEPLLAEIAARGVNALRVWFFHDHDADRFARLLDAGSRHGVRFVVTLGDNVFKGQDWFFGPEDEESYRPHVRRSVERVRGRAEILFWEVMNEPNCGEGRHDDACVKTIGDWLNMATTTVRSLDACHVVTTGMIGDGNYPNEAELYRKAHRKDAVGIISVHRRSTDENEGELALAQDARLPIFYGEVYDKAYDDGCAPLSGRDSPRKRAGRIKDDIQDAIEKGVDGYLLWDLAAGMVTLTDGTTRTYCSAFGYPLDDPLWPELRSAGLPPAAPW